MTRISRQSELNCDMDGVLNLQDLSGQAQLRTNPLDLDVLSPDQADDWVNANGLFSGMRKRQAARQKNRNLRQSSKAKARVMKAAAKQTRANAKQTGAQAKVNLAKAQNTAAQGLSSGDDKVLAAALSQSAPIDEHKGMSTGAKVGIALGIAVVVGVGGYLFYKYRKGKGK